MPRARRVDERERAIEPDLLDHLERLGEVRVGLAREADDDVRPEREVGNRIAQPGRKVDEALARVRASHRLQDPGRPGLERQVHVLADGAALSQCRDHRLSEVLRVRAREADALDPAHGVAGAEELAELGANIGREVASPRVDVLAEERDLLDAVAREGLDLRDDLAGSAALLASSHGGHDAVRAFRVAAHRDLHPGAEAALAVHRQRGGERVVRAEAPARHRVPPVSIHSPRCGIDPGPNATSTKG